MLSQFPDAPAPQTVARLLGDWYLVHARDLPWRGPGLTPWEILLSEVMAQQTPVARVIPIWQRWLTLWPTAADLAAASTQEVLSEWGSLGYPRRALRLQECARQITQDYGGQFPQTYEELVSLPGVGQYTAGAILAFAFGKRALVLDTNVRRVIARVFAGQQFPHPTLSAAEKSFATALVPQTDGDAALWAQSSMELGATVCTARVVQCDACPLVDLCRWRKAGFPPDEFAQQRKPQKFEGTDRQVRGLIMKEIRAANSVVTQATLDGIWPDTIQLGRAIDSLLADGLIDIDQGRFTFPR